MATKQEKAVSRAFLRGKKQGVVREEKHILWFLTAVIIVLLYLLLAQHNHWWPYRQPTLGSAFYTNLAAGSSVPAGAATGSSNPGGSGGSGAGSTGGSTTTPPASTGSGIAGFAAGLNVGNTKAQTSTQANGLSQNCALVVDASTSAGGGQQEVCTYTQGNKIVTVTFLNGRVVSASKTGF